MLKLWTMLQINGIGRLPMRPNAVPFLDKQQAVLGDIEKSPRDTIRVPGKWILQGCANRITPTSR